MSEKNNEIEKKDKTENKTGWSPIQPVKSEWAKQRDVE